MASETKSKSKESGASIVASKSAREQLAEMKAKMLELEKQAIAEEKAKFASLPTQLGYKNMLELVKALIPFCKGKVVLVGQAANSPASGVSVASAAVSTRVRGKVTDELKKQIVDDLSKGEMTSAAIAEKYQLSVPTISAIKKGAGLTQKRI